MKNNSYKLTLRKARQKTNKDDTSHNHQRCAYCKTSRKRRHHFEHHLGDQNSTRRVHQVLQPHVWHIEAQHRVYNVKPNTQSYNPTKPLCNLFGFGGRDRDVRALKFPKVCTLKVVTTLCFKVGINIGIRCAITLTVKIAFVFTCKFWFQVKAQMAYCFHRRNKLSLQFRLKLDGFYHTNTFMLYENYYCQRTFELLLPATT